MATGEINIAELASSSISVNDFFAKADSNGLMTKNTIQALSNFLSSVGTLAFRGVLLSTDATVTEDGIYVAGDAGTYTNNGGLVITVNDKIVLISVTETQTVFEKAEFPISLTLDAVPTDGSTNAVESNGVFDALALKAEKSILENIKPNFYSVFNGTTSKVVLDTSITLELTGDEIEFTVIPTNISKAMGVFGEVGTSTNSNIGWFTNSKFFIKDSGGVNLTTDGFLQDITVDEEIKVKLVWTASNIDVYKNDVFQKSVTKGTVIIDNIGNGYNFFEGKIKGVTIIANSITTSIPIPFDLTNKTDVILENTSDGFLTSAQITALNNAENSTSAITAINQRNTNITEFEPYTNFAGADENITLDTPLVFEDDGDYIEFDVRIDDLGTLTEPFAMGIAGRNADGNNIGFWSSGLLYVRKADNTWLTLDGFNSTISSGEEFTLKLLWDAVDGIKTYKNGVFQKNITNGTISIYEFGNGYDIVSGATFKGGIKNVKLRAKGVDFDIPILFDYADATNNGATLEEQSTFLTPTEKTTLTSANSSETFYTLDINGSITGDELFTVYSRIKGNTYAGIQLHHVVDIAGINANLWRINTGFEYTYDGSAMIPTGNQLLSTGESEFTYRTKDGGGTIHGDFTGGYHGDEIQIEAKFFASGVEITDISADIPLTACNNFYYFNKTNTIAFGTATNETIHDKITTFEKGGYRTFNRIEWLTSPNFYLWFHGISCIHKDCGNYVHNEFLDSFVPNGDNTFKLIKVGAREYYSSNTTTDLSSFTTSELIKPSASDLLCTMDVHDRPTGAQNDNKYYREFIPLVNPSIGDVWESEMVVKFNKR